MHWKRFVEEENRSWFNQLRPFFFFFCVLFMGKTWVSCFDMPENPAAITLRKQTKCLPFQHLWRDISLWSNIFTLQHKYLKFIQGQLLNSAALAISSSNFKLRFFFFCSYATTPAVLRLKRKKKTQQPSTRQWNIIAMVESVAGSVWIYLAPGLVQFGSELSSFGTGKEAG